MTQKLYQSWI